MAWILSIAQELPYVTGAATKITKMNEPEETSPPQKKQKKKRGKEVFQKKMVSNILLWHIRLRIWCCPAVA